MRDGGLYNIKRALPRMSWHPANLFNLWVRSEGSLKEMTDKMKTSRRSLFQYRWISKTLVRAYHGDFIPEKIFKRWYMLQTLPNVRPRAAVVGDDRVSLQEFSRRKMKQDEYNEAETAHGLAPVGSLMFSSVERRIDVFVFRCCFAHSVYEARRLVIHGYVTLNGQKHSNCNTRLAPGDLVSVDPSAIRFFKEPDRETTDVRKIIRDGAPRDYRRRQPTPQPSKEESSSVTAASSEASDKTTEVTDESASAASPDTSSSETSDKAAESAKDESSNVAEARKAEDDAGKVAEVDDGLTPFYLPTWAAPWLFIPPTSKRPRLRTVSQLARMPEDRSYDPAPVALDRARRLHRSQTQKKAAAMSGVIL
ncbi:alpha-L RNA-binding motif-containing protein [Hymenopellis radicata]|nr:alpha-L RNA-binding motif-containing protein [Hymenopellis radicata]